MNAVKKADAEIKTDVLRELAWATAAGGSVGEVGCDEQATGRVHPGRARVVSGLGIVLATARDMMKLTAPRLVRLLVGCAAMVGLVACTREVRPDDMSAQAHRREAAHERASAEAHQKKFEPGAVARPPRPPSAGAVADQLFTDYNPTTFHLMEAERHHAHALEHERAAAQLDSFEDAECRPFAPGIRAACPFMGPIRAVEEIDGGVRLHLAAGASVAAVAAHMRCHFAFARSRAFVVSECPLTLRGTNVTVSAQGTTIDVMSHDRKITAELRRRASALVEPAR